MEDAAPMAAYQGLWTLVTGAGRPGRVGAKIARHMAERGSHIYLHYHSDRLAAEKVKVAVEDAGKEHRVQVRLVTGDLSKEQDVAELFEAITPDIVIHNAAVFEPVSALGEASIAERIAIEGSVFDTNLNVNAKAVVLVTAAALYRMRKEGKTGTFFFIGDAFIENGGVYSGGLVAYTISKVGMSSIVRQYAAEYGRAGFRFLAVLNGPIEPPQTAPAEAVERIRSEINLPTDSLKPWIGGDAVAEVIDLLFQSPAVNGASIAVDGGRAWRVSREH